MFSKLILNRDNLTINDGLVMGHIWPDSDALCASIALARFLTKNEKTAYVFVPNSYPKFLQWLIDENKDIIIFDQDHPFCKNAEFLYILDTEPTEARTGFHIDLNKHKFFNIDHHTHRFNDFANVVDDIEYGTWLRGLDENGNEYYLENAASTCGLLVKLFDIKDDILALGVYHDTFYMTKKGIDACNIISKLDLDDKRFEYMINKCDGSGNRQDFENLINIKTWWDLDNDICVAHDSSGSFENYQIVNFINPYCKILIVISSNKYISLRSNLPILDLSRIAKRMGGGGHKSAAAFKTNNLNLCDLVDVIRNNIGKKAITDEEKYTLQQFQKKIINTKRKN